MEDLCYKSKAALDYDLFMPQRTAVTILSPIFFFFLFWVFFFFFFARRGERELRGGVGDIGVVKAAGFLHIIY